jgi:hypothetical protein
VQGVEGIREHYPLHCQAVYDVAREYFAAEKVLSKLLRDAGL